MPTTPMKNLIYRLRLPLEAPKARYTDLSSFGPAMNTVPELTRIMARNHALGPTVLLHGANRTSILYCSTDNPKKRISPEKIYRVASLTKMVTAMTVLVLCERGALDLDAPAAEILPGAKDLKALYGVSLRHLLSHTSGLQDTPLFDQTLADGGSYETVLQSGTVSASKPGERFQYCNLAFGLLGSMIEAVTGLDIDTAIRQIVLKPLGMQGSLFGFSLNPDTIVPITRVLPYHRGQETVITPLGMKRITGPDPELHFGYTAGSLYTDAVSLSMLLNCIANGGKPILTPAMAKEMKTQAAVYGSSSPTLSYGLGLLIVQDPRISSSRLIGHQGFAYGCANAAFYEEDTGRQLIFLNGGCSEARKGRMGRCNREMLVWAFRKEYPTWH